MRRLVASSLVVLAFAVAGGSATSHAASGGELIVGFRAGVSLEAQRASARGSGGSLAHEFRHIHAGVVAYGGDEHAIANRLEHDPSVRYVEPNAVYSTTTIPNDPLFSKLYGLNNTGQTGGTPDADIDAPEAWDVTTGSRDVTIAVIDTGVDFSHSDLAQQQWVNAGENCGSSDPATDCAQRTNGIDDDGDGYVDDWHGWDFVNRDSSPLDDYGHGTHVSGTIGASGNNGIGVVGVDWKARIMALKAFDSHGQGTTADEIDAILYAADHGAQISSNSWGGDDYSTAMLDAINYAQSKGMLFVAAAGNGHSDNDAAEFWPANYSKLTDDVLAVAATDANDALASFSNWGATTVGLGAPGVAVTSTYLNGGYASSSGTSMATPHVSGSAALVKARFPSASPQTTMALLYATVDHTTALVGKTIANGRLNVGNAVSCSATPEILLEAPRAGFVVNVGESVTVRVVGADCATPAGAAAVTASVNGTPVSLSASTPDNGVYTGSFVPAQAGPLTVGASVVVGSQTATRSVSGTAVSTAPGDTTAPTAPRSLKLDIVGTRSAIVYWQAATDDVGVTAYDVYRDGLKVGTTSGLSYLDGGLAPATTHTYAIRARDAAANTSPASSSVNVKTVSLSTSKTGTAAGAVFDSNTGLPLANVVVSTTVGTSLKQQKTNGSGVFKLTNLPPGVYTLTLKLGARTTQVSTSVTAGETSLVAPTL